MDRFEAQRVMSGTQGEIWIDGKYMAEVTAFQAEIKLVKEEVNQVKTMSKQYKVTGWEGTGNVKMNHVSSYFINLMADNIRNARQTVVTIRAKLDDPDAYGAERVAIYNVSLDEVPIVNWERKTIQKDEVPFTFTSHKFLETAN